MNKRVWVLLIAIPMLAACLVLGGCVLLWLGTSFNRGPFSSEWRARFLIPLQGGARVMLEADVPKDVPVARDEMDRAAAIIENRLTALGLDSIMQVQDERHLQVQIAGSPKGIESLMATGLLEFVDVGVTPLDEGQVVQTTGPATSVGIRQPAANTKVYRTVMTGKDLQSVSLVLHQTTNQPYIAFTLTQDGTRIFAEHTGKNVDRYLAIVIDKKVVSCPLIKSAIMGGSGIIEGRFTQEEVQNLVIRLKFGALPFPLRIVETTPIGR